MKPVRIDWVARRHVPMAWIVLGLSACIAAGAVGGHAFKLQQGRAVAERDIAVLERRLREVAERQTAAPAAPNPRHASLAQAAALLAQDFNPVFATLERIQIPGALLRHLVIDAQAGEVRIEYALDDFARVAQVDGALNAGLERRPWQLEQAGSAGARNGTAVTARWRASLSLLR
ncbi:MAG: hypothetical protein QM617_00645 [Comamonas sp.]